MDFRGIAVPSGYYVRWAARNVKLAAEFNLMCAGIKVTDSSVKAAMNSFDTLDHLVLSKSDEEFPYNESRLVKKIAKRYPLCMVQMRVQTLAGVSPTVPGQLVYEIKTNDVFLADAQRVTAILKVLDSDFEF